jgi:hypothetical protein
MTHYACATTSAPLVIVTRGASFGAPQVVYIPVAHYEVRYRQHNMCDTTKHYGKQKKVHNQVVQENLHETP